MLIKKGYTGTVSSIIPDARRVPVVVTQVKSLEGAVALRVKAMESVRQNEIISGLYGVDDFVYSGPMAVLG